MDTREFRLKLIEKLVGLLCCKETAPFTIDADIPYTLRNMKDYYAIVAEWSSKSIDFDEFEESTKNKQKHFDVMSIHEILFCINTLVVDAQIAMGHIIYGDDSMEGRFVKNVLDLEYKYITTFMERVGKNLPIDILVVYLHIFMDNHRVQYVKKLEDVMYPSIELMVEPTAGLYEIDYGMIIRAALIYSDYVMGDFNAERIADRVFNNIPNAILYKSMYRDIKVYIDRLISKDSEICFLSLACRLKHIRHNMYCGEHYIRRDSGYDMILINKRKNIGLFISNFEMIKRDASPDEMFNINGQAKRLSKLYIDGDIKLEPEDREIPYIVNATTLINYHIYSLCTLERRTIDNMTYGSLDTHSLRMFDILNDSGVAKYINLTNLGSVFNTIYNNDRDTGGIYGHGKDIIDFDPERLYKTMLDYGSDLVDFVEILSKNVGTSNIADVILYIVKGLTQGVDVNDIRNNFLSKLSLRRLHAINQFSSVMRYMKSRYIDNVFEHLKDIDLCILSVGYHKFDIFANKMGAQNLHNIFVSHRQVMSTSMAEYRYGDELAIVGPSLVAWLKVMINSSIAPSKMIPILESFKRGIIDMSAESIVRLSRREIDGLVDKYTKLNTLDRLVSAYRDLESVIVNPPEKEIEFIPYDDGVYKIYMMPHDDSRAILLGETQYSNCCQYIGGAASSCVLEGWVNPRSGFLVIEENGKFLAQSWIHLSNHTNVLCLDSVESKYPDRCMQATRAVYEWAKLQKYEIHIGAEYTKLSISLLEDLGFTREVIIDKENPSWIFDMDRGQFDGDMDLDEVDYGPDDFKGFFKTHSIDLVGALPSTIYSDAKWTRYILKK